MSLEDQFNRNDGSWIDRADTAMINFYKKIGEIWQDKTHQSADVLKRGVYGCSAVSVAVYSVSAPIHYMMMPMALLAGIPAALGGGLGPQSPLEGEIKFKAYGLPAKSWKYLNLCGYGISLFNASIGSLEISLGIKMGDYETVKKGMITLAQGLGLFALTSGNYLHQSSFNPPPPRPKKKPVWERIKEELQAIMPQPASQPIPMQYCSARESYQPPQI